MTPAERGQIRSGKAQLLLIEANVADAAFDGKMNGLGSFAIHGVDVLTVFFFQAMDIDGSQTAVDVGANADVFGETNDGFADAAVDTGLEIPAAFAGEVDVDLARTNVELQ